MANEAKKDKVKNPDEMPMTTGKIVKLIFLWIYRLRSVILSLPVAVAAVILAVRNSSKLPGPLEMNVGINVVTISKDVLVMGPLALTALGILMTLISKRVTYPWLISLFTLILPLVLLFTMTFGA